MRMSILVVLVALSWGRFCLQNGQLTAQLAASPAPAGTGTSQAQTLHLHRTKFIELSSGRQTHSGLEACGVRAARTERERGSIGEVA